MTLPPQVNRPIGFWVRRVDQLLEAQIARAQNAEGLTRTRWQILNVLTELGSAATSEVADALHAFIDAVTADKQLLELAEAGWATSADGSWRLTEAGVGAHAAALERQSVVRRRAMAGISEAEYATTVHVLQQITRNLEEAEQLQSGA